MSPKPSGGVFSFDIYSDMIIVSVSADICLRSTPVSHNVTCPSVSRIDQLCFDIIIVNDSKMLTIFVAILPIKSLIGKICRVYEKCNMLNLFYSRKTLSCRAYHQNLVEV